MGGEIECQSSFKDQSSGYFLMGGGIALLLIITLLLFLIRRNGPKHKWSFLEKNNLTHHAVITGGSSGIGLSIAHECIKLKKKDNTPFFSHITIIARNQAKLEQAKKELLDQMGELSKVVIQTISADISNYEIISDSIQKNILEDATIPKPTILFNVAGTAIPCRFITSDPTIYSHLMSTNYLGSVYTTRILCPHMISNGGGTVVLTSSAAGQVGIYGYSAYSPTKFALRGFAEVLSMELAPHNVHVQLAFPPNTETPGFEKENELKMEECRLMEDAAGLYQPEDIAKHMVKEALRNNTSFFVSFGVEGWFLSVLTSGMSSVHNLFDILCQITFMSLFRFISLFVLHSFHSIVRSCHKKRANE